MKLEVGTEVRAELAPNGNCLRWSYQRTPTGFTLIDNGYTGEFAYGIVSAIRPEKIIDLLFLRPGSDDEYIQIEIAGQGHVAYDDKQWKLPGFVSPVERCVKAFCTCGSDAVYGINNGAHSHWCDLAQKRTA